MLPARGSGWDMESLGLAFSKCWPRVVVDGAACSSIFKVPPARGSGSDMEPLGLAFSKYRPRVVVDGTWSLAFSKCWPRVVVDRTWSRLVTHFLSAARAW